MTRHSRASSTSTGGVGRAGRGARSPTRPTAAARTPSGGTWRITSARRAIGDPQADRAVGLALRRASRPAARPPRAAASRRCASPPARVSQHVEHDRGADVVRQVPAAHPRARRRARPASRASSHRRAGSRPPAGPPTASARPGSRRPVELDRQHAIGARVGQRRGQRPEPRTDLDHAHARTDPGVARDRARRGSDRAGSSARATWRDGSRAPRRGRAPTSYQSSSTWRTPRPSGASCAKASGERSMIRPGPNGPRSSMTTVTERPVARSVTVTYVPKGSHGCAAVSPDHGGSYQEASPVCVVAPVPGSVKRPVVHRPRRRQPPLGDGRLDDAQPRRGGRHDAAVDDPHLDRTTARLLLCLHAIP